MVHGHGEGSGEDLADTVEKFEQKPEVHVCVPPAAQLTIGQIEPRVPKQRPSKRFSSSTPNTND
jgi:hypothetical protein